MPSRVLESMTVVHLVYSLCSADSDKVKNVLALALPNLPNTTQSSVGGSIQSFQVGLVVYMLPMLPRTLATGDLYPDNVEIMSIFNVARHIMVNIEVSAAV